MGRASGTVWVPPATGRLCAELHPRALDEQRNSRPSSLYVGQPGELNRGRGDWAEEKGTKVANGRGTMVCRRLELPEDVSSAPLYVSPSEPIILLRDPGEPEPAFSSGRQGGTADEREEPAVRKLAVGGVENEPRPAPFFRPPFYKDPMIPAMASGYPRWIAPVVRVG